MRHRKNRVAEEMEEDEAEKKRSREEEKREETQESSEKKIQRTGMKEIGRWKDKERMGDSDGGKRERAWERQKQREKF